MVAAEYDRAWGAKTQRVLLCRLGTQLNRLSGLVGVFGELMPLRSLEGIELRLYVSLGTPNSVAAESNLRLVLTDIGELARLEVIHVAAHPERALADRVLVTPTLVRAREGNCRLLIGRLDSRLALVEFLCGD